MHINIKQFTNPKSKDSSLDDKAILLHENTFEEPLDSISAIKLVKTNRKVVKIRNTNSLHFNPPSWILILEPRLLRAHFH